MRVSIAAAAAALGIASSLPAQTTPVAQSVVAPQPVPPPDLSAATPLPGRWSWSPAADGSEAVFIDNARRPQLWLHCVAASRIVSIGRPASAAAAFLTVWTSSQTRALPASFIPATARSTAQVSAYDPLLDALAFSRGRIGVAIGALPAVVAPAWPEIARVVEDCRA